MAGMLLRKGSERAPAGLIATKEEKYALSAAGAGGPEQGGRE